MATRYSEGLLAIKDRVENKDGNMSGGPMFVLERGMKCKWLGVLFAVFTAIAAFGIGNLTQGKRGRGTALSRLLHSCLGNGHGADGPDGPGHAKRHPGIARVCAFFVPVMAVLYILGCMYILIVQADYILPAIRYILDCAFTE